METKITNQTETEITLEVSVPTDEFNKDKGPALKMLGKEVSLKGFRKGHVPNDVLIEHVGQEHLLQEMAQRAISRILPKLIEDNDLRAIGRPNVSVTKLAENNPLEFKIIFTLLPEVTLPDYKDIAKNLNANKKDDLEVTDKEIDDAIADIKKRIAEAEKQSGKSDGTEPELTDEFVKKLGPYTDVADFKTKLVEQMKAQKEHMAQEKHRLTIIEKIIDESNPIVPDLLVDAEVEKMLAQMSADIDRMGMNIDEYLKQISKTEEDLRSSWRNDAEKRAKIQLVLNEISEKENIHAPESEVENQTKALLAQHPPKQGDLKQAEAATQMYVATQLTNDRVFTFLEDQK